jgi:type IV pilus assembly protein PilA
LRAIFIGLAALVVLVILGFAVLAVIGFVATPGLLRARHDANEASAIGSLRTILSAQLTYSAVCAQGSFAPTFDALTRPGRGESRGYLPSDLAGGQTVSRSGYRFTMTGVENGDAVASCNGVSAGKSLRAFSLTAAPEADGGTRYFGTNSDGTIYQATTPFAMPSTGAPSGATIVQ